MTKINKTKPEYAWDNPDVPHKGWTEESVTDLGSPDHICEMCGKEEIRYVHTMSHVEYSTTLDVGEICAGHMTDDYVGPKRTKREAKNLSNNKVSWFVNSTWEDCDAYKGISISIPTSSYRTIRSISATVSEAKNNVWTWSVSSDNGISGSGFAFNRDDAKQRVESYIKTMQTRKKIK